MKKKKWRRFILLLILAIVFTACGQNKEEEKSLKKTNTEQLQAEDGYVYQASFQNLEIPLSDDIISACMYDGRIYMITSKYEEDKKEGLYTYKVYLLSCNPDGSDMTQAKLKLKESDYIQYMGVDRDENFRLVSMRYTYNEKTQKTKDQALMYTIDIKGNIIDTCELKPKDKTAGFYTEAALIFGDTLFISNNKRIYTFDMEGKPEKVYNFGNGISEMVLTQEKEIYAYGYDVDGFVMKELNMETGEFGNAIDFGDYHINNATLAAGENTVYMNDSNNLYCFHVGTGEVTVLFNWINSDINSNNIKSYFPVNNEEFLVLSALSENGQLKAEIANIKRVKSSTIKEKTILNISCVNTDDRVKRNIISFNKENKDYHIELKDYSHYENPAMQLALDINSGQIPDILCTDSLPISQYIKKGLLTDLYPLMEKDKDINKEDFIDSIIQATELDGKLYFMGSTFTMRSLVGSKENLGDMEALTFADMQKLYDNVPEKGEFMIRMTGNKFIQSMLSERMEDYINWNTGEITFDSPEFINLLEFANRFPKEEAKESASEESMPTMVQKRTLMLDNFYIYDLQSIQMYAKMYKKVGGFHVLPYPSKQGDTGLSMSFDGVAMAITEQCNNKDIAWEFMRLFLSYKSQKADISYYGGLPTRKDAMEKALEYAAATKKYTDDDGTIVYPNNVMVGFDDYTVELGPLTKKEVQMTRDIVNRIDKCISFDTASGEINKIIEEEAQAYFAGDKTAEEAAKIIQNRVKIYVSENS